MFVAAISVARPNFSDAGEGPLVLPLDPFPDAVAGFYGKEGKYRRYE